MNTTIRILIVIIIMLINCNLFSQKSYTNLNVGEKYLTGGTGTVLYSKPSGTKLGLVPRFSVLKILEPWQESYYLVEFNSLKGYIADIAFGEEPASMNITAQVKLYVETEINKWQKKGEFEKTSDFYKRVSEQTRSDKVKQLTELAINELKAKYKSRFNTNPKTILLGEYDADNETFLIRTPEFDEFGIKIPINDAQSFKNTWPYVEFKNVELNLKDDQFKIAKLEVYNSKMNKSFFYDSNEPITYSLNNFTYNFKPIEVDIKQDNAVQSKTTIENKNSVVGSSDVDVNIPANTDVNINAFALVIGNENYKNEIKVPFAGNDATVFSLYCKNTLGIPSNNLHLLIDGTYGQMLGEIKWIGDVIKAYNGEARVIVYYAGHGMPGESDKNAYILPTDGNSSITQTAIKLDQLYAGLSIYPSQSVSVFLDACFSGAAREGSLTDGRGVKILPRENVLSGNMVVFSATSADETALPVNEKGHGLFTYYLLKKLQDSQGNVTLEELSNYVIDNVKRQSIVVNNKAQNPKINPSSSLQSTWQNIKLK